MKQQQTILAALSDASAVLNYSANTEVSGPPADETDTTGGRRDR